MSILVRVWGYGAELVEMNSFFGTGLGRKQAFAEGACGLPHLVPSWGETHQRTPVNQKCDEQ